MSKHERVLADEKPNPNPNPAPETEQDQEGDGDQVGGDKIVNNPPVDGDN